MVPEWFRSGSEAVPKLFQKVVKASEDSGRFRSGSGMVPKWFRSGTEAVPNGCERLRKVPKRFQKVPKISKSKQIKKQIQFKTSDEETRNDSLCLISEDLINLLLI